MAGAASQAGDADSSRAPGLTSGLQGSVNVHLGASIVGATVTVHQFFLYFTLHPRKTLQAQDFAESAKNTFCLICKYRLKM